MGPPAPDLSRVELVGGHPALDLVNTVAWRHDPGRTTDRLTDADALVGWATGAGLLSVRQAQRFRAELAADGSLGPDVLAKARSVRALSHRLLQPVAHGRSPGSHDVQAVHHAVVTALKRAEIVDVVPLRWEVELTSVRSLPTALTIALWRLLQFEDLGRLRECLGGGCGWLFLDRSKNGSRVWCSSGDCGNRTRVRRHYRRHHVVGDHAASQWPDDVAEVGE
jgi:predicted RNA-binding Zn ribbon-like protein